MATELGGPGRCLLGGSAVAEPVTEDVSVAVVLELRIFSGWAVHWSPALLPTAGPGPAGAPAGYSPLAVAGCGLPVDGRFFPLPSFQYLWGRRCSGQPLFHAPVSGVLVLGIPPVPPAAPDSGGSGVGTFPGATLERGPELSTARQSHL